MALALVLAAAGAAVFAKDYLPAFATGTRSEASAQEAFPGNVEYDGRLVFVRVRYTMGFSGFSGSGGFRGNRGEPPWMHDYPTADIHMMKMMNPPFCRYSRSPIASSSDMLQ